MCQLLVLYIAHWSKTKIDIKSWITLSVQNIGVSVGYTEVHGCSLSDAEWGRRHVISAYRPRLSTSQLTPYISIINFNDKVRC